ncbi:MAG: monovalent cation/H(+) antiporter subunit G [Ilumatobacteraceae bacterium]
MAGRILILAGSLLTLLAAIGLVRFDDVFARLHSLAKASTAGILLVLIGAALALSKANDVSFVVLAAVLQLLTSPVGANMISLATYRAEGIAVNVHGVDELRQDLDAASSATEHDEHYEHDEP